MYDSLDAPDTDLRRILDVGCGLGFISLFMAQLPETEVVGIDPSEKAIEIAKTEHTAQPNLEFIASSAQDFPDRMKKFGIKAFDRAILNMVLHSVDDKTCIEILDGVRRSLTSYGILTCIVPARGWLTQKLIEKAQDSGMEKGPGLSWVQEQRTKPVVNLAVAINGQPAYEEPITIYNRELGDYATLLQASGYGLETTVSQPESMKPPQTITLPFWEWSDYTKGYELATRDRHILMTQAIAQVE